MISMYRSGTSLVHRLPTGIKLISFLGVSLVIATTVTNPWHIVAALTFVMAAYALAGLDVRVMTDQVLAVRWVILFMLVPQLLFLPAHVAVTNTARVALIVVLAALFSITTRIPDLLDAAERALAPLRRFGVRPESVALTFALTITSVPVLAGFASTIRDAQRARGIPAHRVSFAVPLLIMSLRHADDLADAISARGIEQ
ncbi:energy-coupling factor transporter transmembrane protein EcfT [Agreia sp. COWG]|uniref:energy-coupling factor transporter transmembrane component T family protein n=1 Tax=Agreia sp. COWG TaxID=2773266 RepID=UPI0019291641|nr:energy-coupling factor transporter transmembrane component T [Agreia sp. COWG]CAD5997972.1 Cobalt ABC transporter permease [Agreia sp. COWG]